MTYRTIMVALCGRGNEMPVIHEAVKIAHLTGGKLIALHVNEPHAGEMSMLMNSPGPRLTEESIRQQFVEHGFPDLARALEVQILTDEVVHRAISQASQEVDLLILGHQRMSFFKEKFFDSVDEGIVNHVRCPVLVVPKGD